MNITDTLKIESTNVDKIYLFKEGAFLRAYERSALRFSEQIARFKLIKRYYKVVKQEVCFLGFPRKNLSVLREKHKIAVIDETPHYFIIPNRTSLTNFEEWKANIELPTFEEIKPSILLREPVKPKELLPLQIFKIGYDLTLEIMRLTTILKKDQKYTTGARLKEEAIELLIFTQRVGSHNHKYKMNYEYGKEKIELIRLLLRLLVDLKALTLKAFTRINVQLEHLYLEFQK